MLRHNHGLKIKLKVLQDLWLSSITYSNSWNIMVVPIIKIDKKMIIIPTTPLNAPVGPVNPLLFQRFQTFISTDERTWLPHSKSSWKWKVWGLVVLDTPQLTPPTWSRGNRAIVVEVMVEVFYEWIPQLKVCGISSRFDSPLQSKSCLII